MKKCMKLFLSIILVFLICVGGIEAKTAEAAETGSPVGIWKLLEVTGEMPVSREDLQTNEKLGLVVYAEIREDGTALLSMFGQEAEGNWDEDGISFGGSPGTYTVDGDTLTLDDGTSKMIFGRTSMQAIDEIMGYKEGVLDEHVSYSEENETLLDSEYATLTINGYKADKTGFNVSLRCTNKTDHKLMIGVDKAVINKYAISPDWAVALEANESKESVMRFKPEKLEKRGISAADEMMLLLKVTDSESWTTLQEDVLVTVYPTGKTAEEIQAAERTPVPTQLVVLDNEYCTFIIEGADPSYALGYAVNCYCENKTNQNLTFMWQDEKLNDKEVSGLLAVEVLPGTREYPDAVFMKNILEKNGIKIEDIKKVQGTLRVYGEDLKQIEEIQFAFEP